MMVMIRGFEVQKDRDLVSFLLSLQAKMCNFTSKFSQKETATGSSAVAVL